MNTITSLHVILQIRVAALTEEKRSTYRMLLSLGHRTEQHTKRSNQAELLLMSNFRISRTNQIRSFHWGFPP